MRYVIYMECCNNVVREDTKKMDYCLERNHKNQDGTNVTFSQDWTRYPTMIVGDVLYVLDGLTQGITGGTLSRTYINCQPGRNVHISYVSLLSYRRDRSCGFSTIWHGVLGDVEW